MDFREEGEEDENREVHWKCMNCAIGTQSENRREAQIEKELSEEIDKEQAFAENRYRTMIKSFINNLYS